MITSIVLFVVLSVAIRKQSWYESKENYFHEKKYILDGFSSLRAANYEWMRNYDRLVKPVATEVLFISYLTS